MISLLLFLACPAPSDCTVVSTVSDFTPDCHGAVLARYNTESRLVLPGTNGETLVAYLPADLEETVYGGTSGNPAIFELDLNRTSATGDSGGSSPLAAVARTSTVTFGALSDQEATVQLHVEFEEGSVTGPLILSTEAQ